MNKLNSRKLLSLVALTAAVSIGQANQGRNVLVYVDGQNVVFAGTPAQKMGDHVMVPLRGVFERMGATVDWYPETMMVLARRGDTRVELTVNSNNAMVNGQTIPVQYPPIMIGGSTMVPIRFVSEALGAYVDWDETNSIVNITSRSGATTYGNSNNTNYSNRVATMAIQPRGSVLPVRLDTSLSSDTSVVGERFTATIDTNGGTEYFGLPQGTKVEGHVNFAQPKMNKTPGVLGLSFDNIVLKDGTIVPINASLSSLDSKSVTNNNGRLMSIKNNQKDEMKYVGTGAGAGVLVALATKGNLVTNALLGGALGYLYQYLQKDETRARNVNLDRGTPLGVRFDREARIVVYH